jgi:hypothetical protein
LSSRIFKKGDVLLSIQDIDVALCTGLATIKTVQKGMDGTVLEFSVFWHEEVKEVQLVLRQLYNPR